ncbi:hypothetical protein B4U79_04655 [Dinothrombium tinctorium]|uniref:Peptidase S54 rhomboid domain-containing protein n=1 Tax=Dinothrombium tinctorium TaxID=1965070 RepID=A0A3S3Q1I1_9ACAR|nr:hypothetical protein B4U79_11332 [Dinothrombium tinctorium]RWS11851.1 hypothetical protein B4U79_15740 [Dinothrombium tinctorium]RWS12127.1 hypothetical protein B4U79_10198 [Dinothrombium tinctorium]RWS12354.1 hypothetical protein B4U79_04655 [Dinothrombium tinctorium]
MRPNRRYGERQPSFAILLLLHEMFRTANESGIPPVTCCFIVGQILLFMRYIQVPWSVWDVCISVDKAFWSKDWKRFVFSAFEHADDWHLYYNMVSFLAKGRTLERRFGSKYFLYLLIVFTIMTNITYVTVSYALSELLLDHSYSRTCAVGFSGVIFALKVLTTHYWPSGGHSFMGISITSKYVVWSELILIQLISPNASFVGHLSGIIVGLAYIHGPLKQLMDLVATPPYPTSDNFQSFHQPSYPDLDTLRNLRRQRYR